MPDHVEDALREQAAQWFARMQGPDAERWRYACEEWRRASAAHDKAYRSIEQSWRDSALAALTRTGRHRSLDSIRTPFHSAAPWQKIAASFAVVGLALGAFLATAHLLSRPAEIANAIGQPRVQKLADGSTVTLDTDSAISTDFRHGKRLIHVLRGRVRFDVVHDPKHPFVVDTGHGEVTDVGTLFDVDLTHRQMQVTLYRGAVDVRLDAGNDHPTETRRLAPGQRIIDAGADHPATVSAAPADAPLWANGMLSFDGVPLGKVVAEANRYSTRHIIVDASVADLKVVATFQQGDNAVIVDGLARAFHLSIQPQPNGDWLLVPA